MRALGAELVEYGEDFQAAREEAIPLRAASRAARARPSFHRDLVLGVATYSLELFSAHPDLDTLYVPIGQGSGVCGCGGGARRLGVEAEIVGVQAEGAPCLRLVFRRWARGVGPTPPTLLPTGWRRARRTKRRSGRHHAAGRADRRWSATTRSPKPSAAPAGRTRIILPKAPAQRGSPRRPRSARDSRAARAASSSPAAISTSTCFSSRIRRRPRDRSPL